MVKNSQAGTQTPGKRESLSQSPPGEVGTGPSKYTLQALALYPESGPLDSLKLAVLRIGAGFSLATGILAALQRFSNYDGFDSNWKVILNLFLVGWFTGFMLSVVALVPLYLWLRAEYLGNRTLSYDHPLSRLTIGSGIIVIILVLQALWSNDLSSPSWGAFRWDRVGYWNISLSHYTVAFYRSLMTFGVSSLFSMGFIDSPDSSTGGSGLVFLLTFGLYGLVYQYYQYLREEDFEKVKRYVKQHMNQQAILLNTMGKELLMESMMVKIILEELQKKGILSGELRGRLQDMKWVHDKSVLALRSRTSPSSFEPKSGKGSKGVLNKNRGASPIARPDSVDVSTRHSQVGERQKTTQRPGKSIFRFCSNCGVRINGSSKRCPQCEPAAPVNYDPVPVPQAPHPTNHTPTLCPSCRRPVEDNWKICQYCTTELTEDIRGRLSLEDESRS